jgi:peptide/nickel transport system substrate-binding protein
VIAAVLIGSTLFLVGSINSNFSVDVPDKGGSFTEGVVGSPRFINPVLAISDADKDLVELVFSGLMKSAPDGKIVPDLAESYSVSPDGLTYTFTLRDDIEFHDGTPITSDDVEFTIMKAQDPALKSPKRGNWDGILMEKLDERSVHFTLKQPYSPFLENTTIGILPKNLWKNTSADEFAFSPLNTEPVGSGPYSIASVKRNSAGIPVEYKIKAFKDYTLNEPYITSITLKFYNNENELVDAYGKKEIESLAGISAEAARTIGIGGDRVEIAQLSRVYGIFFNQNQTSIFTNQEVREALNFGLDKQKVVDNVLYGYGQVLNNPTPSTEADQADESLKNMPDEERLAKARNILENAGWVRNEETGIYEKKTKKENFRLAFTISTGDTPELKKAAQEVVGQWKALGADVELSVFESGDLNQNIIRPRKYDALFFGEIIGKELDLYPFWHSSQRNDPGLNIALYANITVDKLLENIRSTLNREERLEKYRELLSEMRKDIPAVFVYSPNFIYLLPKRINGVELGELTTPAERFLSIHKWYIEKNKVWKIFAN